MERAVTASGPLMGCLSLWSVWFTVGMRWYFNMTKGTWCAVGGVSQRDVRCAGWVTSPSLGALIWIFGDSCGTPVTKTGRQSGITPLFSSSLLPFLSHSPSLSLSLLAEGPPPHECITECLPQTGFQSDAEGDKWLILTFQTLVIWGHKCQPLLRLSEDFSLINMCQNRRH